MLGVFVLYVFAHFATGDQTMCRTQVHTDTVAPKYNQDAAVLIAFFQYLHLQVHTSNTKKCLHDLCMFRTQTVLKHGQISRQAVSLPQFIQHCGHGQ